MLTLFEMGPLVRLIKDWINNVVPIFLFMIRFYTYIWFGLNWVLVLFKKKQCDLMWNQSYYC